MPSLMEYLVSGLLLLELHEIYSAKMEIGDSITGNCEMFLVFQ